MLRGGVKNMGFITFVILESNRKELNSMSLDKRYLRSSRDQSWRS